jgi:hypothetical protein
MVVQAVAQAQGVGGACAGGRPGSHRRHTLVSTCRSTAGSSVRRSWWGCPACCLGVPQLKGAALQAVCRQFIVGGHAVQWHGLIAACVYLCCCCGYTTAVGVDWAAPARLSDAVY